VWSQRTSIETNKQKGLLWQKVAAAVRATVVAAIKVAAGVVKVMAAVGPVRIQANPLAEADPMLQPEANRIIEV